MGDLRFGRNTVGLYYFPNKLGREIQGGKNSNIWNDLLVCNEMNSGSFVT